MIKKKFIYICLFVILSNCQRHEVINTHGITYLEKREKLIIVNESNKNDAVKILGQPATRGMSDENLWIYIERTKTRGKLLKLGQNVTKRNNVLVLKFDYLGHLEHLDFCNF